MEITEMNVTEQAVQVINPHKTDKTYKIAPPEDKKVSIIFTIVKRLFDVFASFCALLILLLPMLFIALVVKISSKGPAFYHQERLGLNGKKFDIVKFRTMVVDAEANGAQWSDGDDDPRITKIGRILRKFRLDELPQFWCILKGDMSFVGPRPERECFYEEFETYIDGFKHRLCVIPGLTGLAQISGGYDLKPEEKIIYDMEYINNRSLAMDIKILFKTVAVIFTHDGAK